MIRLALSAIRPWLVALLTLVLCATAATSVAFAAPQFPTQNNTRVIDEAGILSDAVERDLDLKLKGLEDATTDQVVVVTVKDLQGYAIEDYTYQLGRAWGIGQKGQVQASNGETYKNNGIVLLVAPNDRKVRIEVGYGLEPVMTDALSSIIIRNVILPEFKAGDYEAGVTKGADAIVEQLAMDRQVAVQKAQAAATQNIESGSSNGGGFPMIIIIVILFILFLFSPGWLKWFILGQLLSGGRGGGWSGGGGGGFSGGGGSFGGGGSSGSW
ncbi:YgcG family protein [Asticcacaulis sp. AC402]|uniref:TPM domain-containing protein n=1 Tax=Asticcacaulis sp. AC402 TaxID=1282361 RepID=UPI0003C3C741|nr:TPM domain-containing protein [Asticcacaulis sp. AC402]ESQ75622.1 hypothetical protein ABAC402_08845 [Asticcacaulis sp. AC402]